MNEEQLEAQQDAEMLEERTALGYRKEGKWRGHSQYKCNHCAYDSLSEATIRDHTIKAHQDKILEAAGVRKLGVTLYDADDKKIEYVSEEPDED